MIDVDTLKQRYTYDPKTGDFFHKITTKNGKKKAGDKVSYQIHDGYRRIKIDSKRHAAHRLAWLYYYGSIDNNLMIDHIDGDRQNNKINNLRQVTNQQNSFNQRKSNRFNNPYIGTTFNKSKKKWVAQIAVDGEKHHLGYFSTAEEASMCYQKAKKRLHIIP